MTPYYADDAITIYLGDCREVAEWLAGDVMVTDPPYGIRWRHGALDIPGHKVRAAPGIANDHDTTIRDEALRRFAPRPAVVFGSFYGSPPPAGRHVLVWQKPADAGLFGPRIGWRRDVEAIWLVGDWPTQPATRSSLVRSLDVGSQGSYCKAIGHPHAKPLDVMRYLIGECPPGVVVDPFCGSGSTLRAAKDLGRRAIGVELDERYCEIAARRCAQEVLAL